MNREKPVLWIVIPCFNESDVLPITAPLFKQKVEELVALEKISEKSRILFVNDGSSDSTWDIIRNLSKENEVYLGISQSRNRGHQSSLLAGLMEAKDKCDITISIDCDGQDDINAMNQMVDEYLDGADVVYGVRDNRETDTWFKRTTAQSFYKLLNRLGGEIVYNHADYRLVSARVLESMSEFEEVNLFLRGMFPLVGYKSCSVYYKRTERLAGKSHYPLGKMIGLAVDGITSLSTKPIGFIVGGGIISSLVGLIGILWAIIQDVTGKTEPGWASLVCVICFFGGLQLLSIGVVGEYVGKTYMEAKHRPRYIVSERTWEE